MTYFYIHSNTFIIILGNPFSKSILKDDSLLQPDLSNIIILIQVGQVEYNTAYFYENTGQTHDRTKLELWSMIIAGSKNDIKKEFADSKWATGCTEQSLFIASLHTYPECGLFVR